MTPTTTTSGGPVGRKQRDIRFFFGRKSRRTVQDVNSKSHPGDEATATVFLAGDNGVPVCPPQELEKQHHALGEGEGSVGELCEDIKQYMSLIDTEFATRPSERDMLVELLESYQITCMDLDHLESPLECRFVRKLLEYESGHSQVPQEQFSSSAMSWLGSPSFLNGIKAFSKLVTGSSSSVPVTTSQEAWDLLMVMEPLVRADTLIQVDRVLNSRITASERYILQVAIWQSENPLYDLLQKEALTQKRPRTRRDSIGSPSKALRSMTSTSVIDEGSLTGLEFFFRKLLRLSASIIDRATADLGLSGSVRQTAWSLFVGSLEDELSLQLLLGRNLLTIIACSVYSIAKLLDEDRSFAQVISSIQQRQRFDHLPRSDHEDAWFRHISRGPLATATHCDIVEFYNTIYLSKMKTHIYALRTPRTPQKPLSKTSGAMFPDSHTARVALTRNVILDVTSTPRHVTEKSANNDGPACVVSILGNLGVRRVCQTEESEKIQPDQHYQVARRLDF